MTPAKTIRRRALPLTALIAAGVLAAAVGLGPWSADHTGVTGSPDVIGGPYARLLAQATDLGPSRPQQVQLTAALHRPARPANLTVWGQQHGLSVRWRDGDSWAIVEGQSQAVAQAFGVAVRDYRSATGEVFHASPQQPGVPAATRAEVAGLGRIISVTPTGKACRPLCPATFPTAVYCPLSCGTPTT